MKNQAKRMNFLSLSDTTVGSSQSVKVDLCGFQCKYTTTGFSFT